MKRWYLIGVLALILLSSFFSYRQGRKAATIVLKEKTDTLLIRDTHTLIKPVYITNTIVDTMLVPVTTIVNIHDTLFLPLPREQKVYQDSTYRAVVSGFRPSLDEISVYSTTQVITKTIVQAPPRWCFSATAGPALVYDGSFHPGIGVAVGFSYRLGN